MWIKRDFLKNFNPSATLEAILIQGPRQVGKSAMMWNTQPSPATEINFDDPNLRALAKENPQLLIQQSKTPCLIDEAQYVPEIFSAIKIKIDQDRRKRMTTGEPTQSASYRITGSNPFLLEKSAQESLAGRVNQYYLLGLSYDELYHFHPDLRISDIFQRGGFPELWVRPEINTTQYLNDYISTYIEKDIARSYGVEKTGEFLKLLKFLAARTGSLLNYESLGNDANIAGKTVKEWIFLLQKTQIIYTLKPYSSNLNKRLIKMPKVYFLDLGLCVRLQAQQNLESLLFSAHGGQLFETLVVSEAIKTKINYMKDWQFSFWRTKEKEEIDLIIESHQKILLIEIKLGFSGTQKLPRIPNTIIETDKTIHAVVVTAEETPAQGIRLPSDWHTISLKNMKDFLLTHL